MTTPDKSPQNLDTFSQLDSVLNELRAYEDSNSIDTEALNITDSTAFQALMQGVLESIKNKFSHDPRGGRHDASDDYIVDKKIFNKTPIETMTFRCLDPRRAAIAKHAIAWAARGSLKRSYHPFHSESTLYSHAEERMLWPHAILGSNRISPESSQLLLAPVLRIPGTRSPARQTLLLADVKHDANSMLSIADGDSPISFDALSQHTGATVSPTNPNSLVLKFSNNSKKDFRKFVRKSPNAVIVESEVVTEISAKEIDHQIFSGFNMFRHLGILAIGFDQVQRFSDLVRPRRSIALDKNDQLQSDK